MRLSKHSFGYELATGQGIVFYDENLMPFAATQDRLNWKKREGTELYGNTVTQQELIDWIETW